MKCVELNPQGNFDSWDNNKIKELRTNDTTDAISNYLKYEDGLTKLWSIVLEPYERVHFQKFKNNYSITCLTDGLAISRFMDGKISLLKFKEGDTSYHEVEGSGMIVDFENIGEEILKIAILEHKPSLKEPPVYS